MWKNLISAYVEELPKFNDYLLMDFRQEKIAAIPEYISQLFDLSIQMVKGSIEPGKPCLEYVGYSELTPKERLEHIKRKNTNGKKFDIRTSRLKLVKYDFSFMGEIFSMVIDIPYIHNHALVYEGSDYYPIFAIIEKGGMSRFANEVVLQVMRARLKFWRAERCLVRTTVGDQFKEINVTCKLHQAGGRGRKKPPLLIYHLAKFGFKGTMQYHGINDRIQIIESDVDPVEKGFKFIFMAPKLYLKVDEVIINETKEQNARRILVSLCEIYKFHNEFDYRSAHDCAYYIVVLGKWTYPSVKKETLLYTNAITHLKMNESMLDPAAQNQYRSVGIDAKDLDELLLIIFNNIDKLLRDYRPNDLYNKKIGALDQMMVGLVRTFNNKALKCLVNSKTKLTRDNIISLMNSTKNRMLTSSTMFRSNPTFYNPNFLLTIGGKRFRSVDNTEIVDGVAGSGSLPIELLKAHPSQMYVESIMAYPSSNPVVSGTINPFCIIDTDGNVIPPVWKDEIEHVFDV